MSIKILLVSAEADPFAKVGGLGDIIGSLPQALKRNDVDARVMMPFYGFIDQQRFNIVPLFSFDLVRPTGTMPVEVLSTMQHGIPIYFLRSSPYFGDETSVYTDWARDCARFVFFNQAIMAALEALADAPDGWFPDVIHVNDWHTGLLPFLVDQQRGNPRWGAVGTVVSIHNIAYQGDNIGGWLWEQAIPPREHPALLAQGLTDNMLAIAIAYSDMVSTVSPRYAVEIQYPYMSYGLDTLIRTRLPDLRGILNGIDVDQWNPATDPNLVANYDASNFDELRVLNKRQLQADAGLPVNDETPVIGLVSRLVYQKGIDLAIPALRWLLAGQDVQFIALGTGDADLNQQLFQLGRDFHWKAATFLGYNATVAQRVYGGVDLFLMPSRYEPCGVGQMMAMRYGALPLVRETGGLADTVQNYDNEDADLGTGFSFQWEQVEAIYNTTMWALETFWNRKDAWVRMQRRAMETDFSWTKSARQYVDMYQRALQKRKGRVL